MMSNAVATDFRVVVGTMQAKFSAGRMTLSTITEAEAQRLKSLADDRKAGRDSGVLGFERRAFAVHAFDVAYHLAFQVVQPLARLIAVRGSEGRQGLRERFVQRQDDGC